MQTILRNPLASPFTLGVSSGASFGAAVAMILGIKLVNLNFLFQGYSFVAVNAFVFGCLSLVIVMGVSKLCNNSTTVLILTGTAISSLFSAGVSILKYISNAESLKNLEIWLMGGFWGANWNAVLTILPFFVVCIIYVLLCAWDLNSMSAGEDVARTMGVNVLGPQNCFHGAGDAGCLRFHCFLRYHRIYRAGWHPTSAGALWGWITAS